MSESGIHSQRRIGHSYGTIINYGTAHLGDSYTVGAKITDNEREYQKLLRSLDYPSRTLRHDSISEPWTSTFEWIFKEDDSITPWDNFVQWLRNGEEMYLIEGKAGSGKSTLMKFVLDTADLAVPPISQGQQSRMIKISHFFWLAGTLDQRSMKGILASLAYQLVQALGADEPVVKQTISTRGSYLKDWVEAELTSLIFKLCRHTDRTVLIVVDALDEYRSAERPSQLVGLLSIANGYSNVKICVSSRPLIWLDSQFATAKRLRLQDLTKADIHTYADQLLDQEFDFYASELKSEKTSLVRLVGEKAEGVFLWVKYALHSVVQGIGSLDDISTLKERLHELPSEMEDLYKLNWRRQQDDNERHRAEASRYLACGKFLPISVFELAVTMDDEMQKHYRESVIPLGKDILDSKCVSVRRRLMVRTAGLLSCDLVSRHLQSVRGLGMVRDPESQSVHPTPNLNTASSHEASSGQHGSYDWYNTRVTYLHRTVHDFLTSTEFGMKLSMLQPDEQDQLCTRRLIAYLAVAIEDCAVLLQASWPDRLCQLIWHNRLDNPSATLALVDRILQQIVQRILPHTVPSAWLYELQKYTNSFAVATDLTGLVVSRGSLENVQDFVLNLKPSTHYKTYLLTCATVGLTEFLRREHSLSARTPEASYTSANRFLIFIKWLIDTGAKVTARIALPLYQGTLHYSQLTKHLLSITPLDISVTKLLEAFFRQDVVLAEYYLNVTRVMLAGHPDTTLASTVIGNFRSTALLYDSRGCEFDWEIYGDRAYFGSSGIVVGCKIFAHKLCSILDVISKAPRQTRVAPSKSPRLPVESIASVGFVRIYNSSLTEAMQEQHWQSSAHLVNSKSQHLILRYFTEQLRPGVLENLQARLFPKEGGTYFGWCMNRLGLLYIKRDSFSPSDINADEFVDDSTSDIQTLEADSASGDTDDSSRKAAEPALGVPSICVEDFGGPDDD